MTGPSAQTAMAYRHFLGVYPTGFADRTTHVEQLVDGPTVTSFTLHDARMLTVSESAVLLSYRAESNARRQTRYRRCNACTSVRCGAFATVDQRLRSGHAGRSAVNDLGRSRRHLRVTGQTVDETCSSPSARIPRARIDKRVDAERVC